MIPPSLPFTVTGGEVAKVSARVPFPNLWSDPLALTVDSLTLDIAIASSSKGKRASPAVHHIDLASSVTSAAGDFVHDELDAFEGAELDRTIRESLILQDDLPGAFPPFNSDYGGGSPAAVESTTVLASLVERVLARLECRVKNICLRVRYETEDLGGVLELRIGQVRYADETPESVSGGTPRTVRVVTLSSVGVYLLPLPKDESSVDSRNPLSRMTSASSYSSSSMSSDDDVDDFQEMVMSQAVADLRVSSADRPPPNVTPTPLWPTTTSFHSAGSGMFQSASGSGMFQSASGSGMFQSARGSMFKSAMSTASGRSVYHSFTEEPAVREPLEIEDPFGSPPQTLQPLKEPSPDFPSEPPSRGSQRTSRSATPVPAPGEQEETLLLSFGPEDIVLRMTTSTLAPKSSREWAKDPGSPIAMPRLVETPVPPIPSIRVDVSVGMIACVLLPSHSAFVLGLAQAALASSGSGPPAAPPAIDPPTSQPKFDAELRVKGFYVALVYDLNPPSSEYAAIVDSFFARPASVYPPVGHLRLKLEDMAAAYSVPAAISKPTPRKTSSRRRPTSPTGAALNISVSSVSLFEYLASAESGDDEPPGGTFPVLIFDPNLPKQYEVPPGAPSSLLSTHKRGPANLTSFPQFDSVDWRNAGVQKAGAEKAWRVRPRAKGILRGQAGLSPEPATTAIAIRKDLDDNERKLSGLSKLTSSGSCRVVAHARLPRSLPRREVAPPPPLTCPGRPDPKRTCSDPDRSSSFAAAAGIVPLSRRPDAFRTQGFYVGTRSRVHDPAVPNDPA